MGVEEGKTYSNEGQPTLKAQLIISLGLLIALAVTFISYSPSLHGNFFTLDDAPTLSLMNLYGEIDSLDEIQHFIFSGSTGPSGRPLALATFLIDDNQWPGSPQDFRYTNILFHLLTGILIFLVSRKLLGLYDNSTRANILALTIMSIWLLHPLNSTTVLYIVQRMTILASAITLTGMLFYLRYRLQADKIPPVKLSLILISIVCVFTFTGILAKEIAALLPLYIIAIEFAFAERMPQLHKRVKQAGTWFAIITAVVAFSYLLVHSGRLLNAYDFREFSLLERVLVQPLILFKYLSNIVFPRPFGISIFHDDAIKYLDNTALVGISIFALVSLTTVALYLRKKQPILTFSVLWFIFGHSIESTILPLELYFEHRNYLPMMGIIFGLVYYMAKLPRIAPEGSSRLLRGIYYTPLAGLVALSLLSNVSVSLNWRAAIPFYEKAITEHPDSIRAGLLYYTYVRYNNSFPGLADFMLADINKRFSRHLTPKLYKIEVLCDRSVAADQELANIAKTLKSSNYIIDFSSVNSLKTITKRYIKGTCVINSPAVLNEIVTLLEQSKQATASRKLRAHIADIEADIMIHNRDLDGAINALEKLYSAQPTVDPLLHKIDLLISAGLFEEASRTIDKAYATDRKRKAFSPSRHDEIKQRELLIHNYEKNMERK